MIKKLLLAESYKEVTGLCFADLGDETSLMVAMQKNLRGSDWVSDISLRILMNESSKLERYVNHYRAMYADAFVAANQCERIDKLNQYDLKYGHQDNSEQLVLVCLFNWEMQGNFFAVSS